MKIQNKKALHTLSLPYSVNMKCMVSQEDYLYGLNNDKSEWYIKMNFSKEKQDEYKKYLASAKKANKKVKNRDANIKYWESKLASHEIERDFTITTGHRYSKFTFHKSDRYDVFNYRESYSGEDCFFSVIASGLTLNFSMKVVDYRKLFYYSTRKRVQRRKNWILKKKIERVYKGKFFKVYSNSGWGDGHTYDYGMTMLQAIECYHKAQYRKEGPLDLSYYVSKNSYSKALYVDVLRDSEEMGLNMIEDDYELTWEREGFDPGDI